METFNSGMEIIFWAVVGIPALGLLNVLVMMIRTWLDDNDSPKYRDYLTEAIGRVLPWITVIDYEDPVMPTMYRRKATVVEPFILWCMLYNVVVFSMLAITLTVVFWKILVPAIALVGLVFGGLWLLKKRIRIKKGKV